MIETHKEKTVSTNASQKKLSHVDSEGHARMVSVTEKSATRRTAIAEAFVRMEPSLIEVIREGAGPKGPVIETARLAGICAAKKTGELIPLCHPLGLDFVDVECEIRDEGIHIIATAELTGKTGVEMEALTAASVTALTLYDMTKALSKSSVIESLRLLEKTGGKSGPWKR